MYYLDHCGSTPLAPEVLTTSQSFLDAGIYGNPAAAHHEAGQKAGQLVVSSRKTIADALGASVDEIILTSGATEANNLLLWGFALRYRARGCHIIFGATEHKSVYDTCLSLAELPGVTAQEAPVDRAGLTDLTALKGLLDQSRGRPTLVAIMHTNNEIPARQPIEDISKLCLNSGAFFHCDGVQGYVREKINFGARIFGSYVISAHKIYGPKGLGILVLGDNPLSPRLTPAYRGGNHERGIRPGTLNTLAIAAGAKAISVHESKRRDRVTHMSECARVFVDTIRDLQGFRLTVPVNDQAAGIVNFYVEGLDAQTLLANTPEVCINRGASCTGSGGETFSHVPKALGLPVEIGANVLRASFGDGASVDQCRDAAKILVRNISKLASSK
jgi:cysteine desulfurase